MNDFRERLLSGKPLRDPLLREKKNAGRPSIPKLDEVSADTLRGITIPRATSRSGNQRTSERHRLLREEQAAVVWNEQEFVADVINVSGGGAMISAPFAPHLWDRVDLALGEGGTFETAVRWIKNGRLGLEFAHETRIDAAPDVQASLLREVLARSFPEAAPVKADNAAGSAPPPSDASRREGHRHPLIWSAQVHYDYESTRVRLRNISPVGALIDSAKAFPVGAEVMLDLGEGGSVFGTVQWVCGDQAGLCFQTVFDLRRLSQVKPQVAPSSWLKPDYLRDESPDTSPWASEWGRLTVDELRSTLRR